MEGEGEGRRKKKKFPSLPSPSPVIFFCFRPNFLDELAARKRLPRRLVMSVMQSARSRRSYGKIGDCEPSTTTTTTRIHLVCPFVLNLSIAKRYITNLTF